jgi:hypothetical protein
MKNVKFECKQLIVKYLNSNSAFIFIELIEKSVKNALYTEGSLKTVFSKFSRTNRRRKYRITALKLTLWAGLFSTKTLKKGFILRGPFFQNPFVVFL